MKKRILVPTDFSEEANSALESARTLAEDTESELLLLHVIEDPHVQTFQAMGDEAYDPMENIYVMKIIEVTKSKLESIVNEERFANVKIDYKLDIGNAYKSISEQIVQHGCSLVIMGTKGAGGLQEMLIGSNADKVVRYSNCPVITVKESRDLRHVNNIVFATDLRDDQLSIIEELSFMQNYYNATLHLIKVYDSTWVKEEEVKERMQKFAEIAGLKNYTLHPTHGSDEAYAIMDFAREIDADLIAMGAHDRHGLLYMLAGHVSKDVVNHAKIPIWTKSIKS